MIQYLASALYQPNKARDKPYNNITENPYTNHDTDIHTSAHVMAEIYEDQITR